MRRFDKLKNINKVNLLNEARYLESKGFINEGLLTEIDVYQYKFNNYHEYITDRFIATFNADGLRYSVVIEHNPAKSSFGEFEVSFSVDSQKHTSERQGRDLKHLNSVLYTVLEITEKTVKRYKIQKIKFEGAGDDKDTDMFDTLRSRLYNRLVDNRYPSDAISKIGRYTYIDMSKVFPDEISSENIKLNSLIDLLLIISDEDPNKESIMRSVDGLNDDNFNLSTDSILNSELGDIYIDISVSSLSKEYDVSYNIYDINEEESESFERFKDLYKFIEDRFINVERNTGNDITPEVPELDNTKETNLSNEEHEAELIKNAFNNIGESGSEINHMTVNPDGYMFGSFNIYINKNGEKIRYSFFPRKNKINKNFTLSIHTKTDRPKNYTFNNINELITFINSLN
jgi:hypothetical protein